MKVILLKDVAKVGQHGTIHTVADGYGMNFLIARGLAVQATPEKIKSFEAQRKAEEAARSKENAVLKSAVQALEGSRFEIKTRATEKGGLFKSIGVADIKKLLPEHIPAETVLLPSPIKEVGEYPVTIRSAGAEAKITLAVVAL